MFGLGLDDTLLNLSFLGLLQPPSHVLDPLVVCPIIELLLGKVQDLPSLVFEYLVRQLLHFCGSVGTLSGSILLEVEVDGDLLFIENEVQEEQIVLGHKRDWIDEAAAVQESLEIVVLLVLLDLFFKLVDIEVALGMPELLLKILHPLEHVLTSEAGIKNVLSCLEGLIVN